MSSSPRLNFRSPGRSRPASAEINLTELLRREKSLHGLDQDPDKLLKEWDESIQKKDRETFLVRAIRNSGSRHRLILSGLFGDKMERRNLMPIERVSDRGSTHDLSDNGLSNSSEHVDEDSHKPKYYTCTDTGRRMVRLQYDVSGYEVSDIKIKLMGRKLVISAHHHNTESGKRSSSEFCRKIRLPDDIDLERLTCTHNEHMIIAEAPVIARDLNYRHRLGSMMKIDSLNIPIIRHTEMGRMLYLFVDLGRIFNPDDVVVKLRGHDRLVIRAQREENNENDSLSASVTREFHLPEHIYPHSLKAGLTQDGVLNVNALVQENVLSNGETTQATENLANQSVGKESDIHNESIKENNSKTANTKLDNTKRPASKITDRPES